MNPAAALSITAAVLAVYVGLVARRLSPAPGWRDQHWFSLIAFTSAGYALCNLVTTLGAADRVVLAVSQVQGACAVLQAWAWLGYAEAFLGPTGRAGRHLRRVVLAAAVLLLVPGLSLSGEVVVHAFEPFGVRYKDAVPTPGGYLLFSFALIAAIVLVFRFTAAWRRGREHAALHAASFVAILLFGVNDALASSGRWPAPYLLDWGFVIPVLALGWSLTARFVRDARALDALTHRLEGLVQERTAALVRAQAALLQAERLASLGEFASGIAHQVNNPAAVVTANLRHVVAGSADLRLPVETAEVLAEALEAMERINALVRKLVDAGRLAEVAAGGDQAPATAALERAVRGLGLSAGVAPARVAPQDPGASSS